MPDNCTLVDWFTKVPIRSMWVPRSRAMETGHFHLASMVFAWPALHEPLLIEGFSCPIGQGCRRAPPSRTNTSAWCGADSREKFDWPTLDAIDDPSKKPTNTGRTNPTIQTRPNDQIDPNHSNGPTLAIEFDADDGQFRSGCLTIENGSSSIQIEYFRRFIEQKISIHPSAKFDIGKIRWAISITNESIETKSMNPTQKDEQKANRSNGPILVIEPNAADGQFRSSCLTNKNASSSIEIDSISAAFHRTKGFSNPMAAIDHPRRITMAKTSGTEPTITNESIETKSMNPTRKRRTKTKM